MAYRRDMTDISDKELSFKYHTQEFIDVSEELRRVAHIGRLAKREIGLVRDFYDSLEFLDEIYSSYFRDANEIAERLEKCERHLYKEEYLELLEKHYEEPSDKEIYKRLRKYEDEVIKRLKRILKTISEDLVWSELRPKPSEKRKEEFPEVEDKVLKEVMRGFKDVIKAK